eukprot:4379237-Prymnesium_polylepis.1
MLGFGSALKMLLLPHELLPTAFSRDEIVGAPPPARQTRRSAATRHEARGHETIRDPSCALVLRSA